MITLSQQKRFESILGDSRYPKQIWDEILVENEHFACIPSKGSIVPGWVLIIPKAPYLSLACLPFYLQKELRKFCAPIERTISEIFGPPTVFEHGPAHVGTFVGCGLDYAHLHFVPLNFSLASEVIGYKDSARAKWLELRDRDPLQHVVPCSQYMFIVEPDGRTVISTEFFPESQYLRKTIARRLNRQGEWDYSRFPCLENVRTTVNAFSLRQPKL